MKSLNVPKLFKDFPNHEDIDTWLDCTEIELVSQGYHKYKQDFKGEEFAYWKKFHGYSICVLFYDWRKYENRIGNDAERISIQYGCLTDNSDARYELIVAKEGLILGEFEVIARAFYESMKPFI